MLGVMPVGGEQIEAQLAALGLAHKPGAVILTLDRVIHPRELLLLGEAHPAVLRRTLAARSGLLLGPRRPPRSLWWARCSGRPPPAFNQ